MKKGDFVKLQHKNKQRFVNRSKKRPKIHIFYKSYLNGIYFFSFFSFFDFFPKMFWGFYARFFISPRGFLAGDDAYFKYFLYF